MLFRFCSLIKLFVTILYLHSYNFFLFFIQRPIQFIQPRQNKPSVQNDICLRSVCMDCGNSLQLLIWDRDIRVDAEVRLRDIFLP